jgi:hypothetical protein
MRSIAHAKQIDQEFREDIRPLLRAGIPFDIDAEVARVDQRLIPYLDAAWTCSLLTPT